MQNLQTRTSNLGNFKVTAKQDIEHWKESFNTKQTQRRQLPENLQEKTKEIKKEIEELNQKEEEIAEMKKLATTDLYLKAYSRRENILLRGNQNPAEERTQKIRIYWCCSNYDCLQFSIFAK